MMGFVFAVIVVMGAWWWILVRKGGEDPWEHFCRNFW